MVFFVKCNNLWSNLSFSIVDPKVNVTPFPNLTYFVLLSPFFAFLTALIHSFLNACLSNDNLCKSIVSWNVSFCVIAFNCSYFQDRSISNKNDSSQNLR